MNRTDFDVIVVGVGAMGSAACYHAARRGARVLGLDQFAIPHSQGSSHGYSRLTRMAYYEHLDYVPLLKRAWELWEQLEEASGQKLLFKTGGLYMGHPDGEVVRGSLASAQRNALAHELLDAKTLAARYPQFQLPGDFVGVYEPRGGILAPEKIVWAHCQLALKAGAELHGNEPLEEWHIDGDRVSVRTARGTYTARKIIFAAGAWSAKLLDALGVKLIITRQISAWVWPKDAAMFEASLFPAWAIDVPGQGLWYGAPLLPDNPGLKVALHFPGMPTDPGHVAPPQRHEEELIRTTIRRILPAADCPLLGLRTCLYSNSPDSHFIIDRHPRHPQVLVAAGFSGHGFKFASVIGEALCDLALNDATHLPVEFLGLGRFGI
jgi:sarcosine oxidase